MRYLVIALSLVFLYLQYRFWAAEGGYLDVARLNKQIQQQTRENQALKERNRVLAAEVDALRQGVDSLEERARSEMGMVKEGETFFLFVPESAPQAQTR
jgi:cell division protein FtsB